MGHRLTECQPTQGTQNYTLTTQWWVVSNSLRKIDNVPSVNVNTTHSAVFCSSKTSATLAEKSHEKSVHHYWLISITRHSWNATMYQLHMQATERSFLASEGCHQTVSTDALMTLTSVVNNTKTDCHCHYCFLTRPETFHIPFHFHSFNTISQTTLKHAGIQWVLSTTNHHRYRFRNVLAENFKNITRENESYWLPRGIMPHCEPFS